LVKVVFAPWEEVVIHEAVKHSLEDLVNQQALGVQSGGLARPLLWAEEIAFIHEAFPPTTDIIKENLQGRVHWAGVRFAIMPEFKNVIVTKEANIKVPVIGVRNNTILRTVAIWLKENADTL
jgi:hypothetical protein